MNIDDCFKISEKYFQSIALRISINLKQPMSTVWLSKGFGKGFVANKGVLKLTCPLYDDWKKQVV